jgi:hypothetical protein
MMLQRKNKSNQLYKSQLYRGVQIVDYRRRLRRVIIGTAARFLESNPQWSEYFFDLRFLLNRGLPIVEAHLAGTISNGAIDLALAWAEEWPSMNASQRKVCLQAQTVIAAKLLTLVTEQMLLPRPPFQKLDQEREESWRGMGIPFAYVKSHNPLGRSDVHQQLLAKVVQHQGEFLRREKGLHLPTHRRPVATAS